MNDVASDARPTVAAIQGCLWGGAVGDALGLPYEGLSRQRAARMWGPPTRHRFLPGMGMISDDTEHSCMTLQAWLASSGESRRFQNELARRLKWWFLRLPAGIGLATARSMFKLWLGSPPSRSGVFSAGNGPAMRAAILGVVVPADQLLEFVTASSQITHTDPRANWGALTVALAARFSMQHDVDEQKFLCELRNLILGDQAEEFLTLIADAVASVAREESAIEYCEQKGLQHGVSGFVNHTVPVAIHVWLSFPRDYRKAVTVSIQCGGDTDTLAAIVGGIVGAGVGPEGLPQEWTTGMRDWPLTLSWMRELATSATGEGGRVREPASIAVLARNLVFLAIVLAHGLRRALPPW